MGAAMRAAAVRETDERGRVSSGPPMRPAPTSVAVRMRRTFGALALLAALLPARARLTADGPVDSRLAEAREAYVSRLEGVAAWSAENQVYLERDKAYALILRLAPDHPRSRSALKYVRLPKGGGWAQKDYVPPKNWNKGMIAAARKKLDDAFGPYRDAVLGALDEAGPDLPSAKREEAFEGLVDLAPDDATLRSARGDVEQDGHWYLPETIEGSAQRAAFQALRARVRAEPLQVAQDADAKGWDGALTTGPFSVWSADAAECEPMVRLLETAARFVRGAIPTVARKETKLQVILLTDRERARKWVARQGPEYAQVLRDVERFGSVWLPTGRLLCYLDGTQARRKSVLRQVVGLALEEGDFGDRDRGWIPEGLQQRLCWHADRTHGNSFGKKGDTADVEKAAGHVLPDAEEDWLAAAAASLAVDPVPRFRALLTRRLNAMEAPDALAAYALGAYLLEGRPEALLDFVKATMTLDDADKQAEAGFGVDAATLAWRVRRWAMETAGRDDDADTLGTR
jgi:hypothetical protein